MRRISNQFALVAVSLLCILILAACNNNSKPVLRYVLITPASATITAGNTQQFTATGYFSDGSTQSNFAVTWSSSTQSVATIDNTGVATALAAGTTTITASAPGTPGATATLSVNQLLSISVSPATATIAITQTQQYSAMGTFKNPDGSTAAPTDITTLVDSANGWKSGTPAVATIDNTGLATGVAAGSTAITATLYGVTSTPAATLTVSGTPVPVSLVVSPATPTIAVGNALTFTVQEKLSDGSLRNPPAGAIITWSSNTPASAAILANAGIAAGFAPGTPTITANETSPAVLTGSVTLTVVQGVTHYAYVSNGGDPDVGWYTVTADTAPYLNSPLTVFQSGIVPFQTVLEPTGKYMYVINVDSTIWVYNITAGAPSYSGLPQQPGGASNTDYGVVDPYGRFFYMANLGDSTIYAFQISPADGSLTAVTGSPFTTNVSTPQSIVIDHSGSYLYVTNSGNDTVSAYQIDQTLTASGGALAPLATPTYPTGNLPALATLDPTGTYMYIATSGTSTGVTTYTIGAGGALGSRVDTPLGGTAVLAYNVVVAPSGKYLYVLDQGVATGQVYGFNVTAGGVIGTAIAGTPIGTGALPFGLAIDPTGSLLATENNFDGPPGTISLFSIGAGGVLTADPSVNTGSAPTFITFYNAP